MSKCSCGKCICAACITQFSGVICYDCAQKKLLDRMDQFIEMPSDRTKSPTDEAAMIEKVDKLSMLLGINQLQILKMLENEVSYDDFVKLPISQLANMLQASREQTITINDPETGAKINLVLPSTTELNELLDQQIKKMTTQPNQTKVQSALNTPTFKADKHKKAKYKSHPKKKRRKRMLTNPQQTIKIEIAAIFIGVIGFLTLSIQQSVELPFLFRLLLSANIAFTPTLFLYVIHSAHTLRGGGRRLPITVRVICYYAFILASLYVVRDYLEYPIIANVMIHFIHWYLAPIVGPLLFWLAWRTNLNTD